MKLYGLDLGKGYTKIYDGKVFKTIPSVIGHPEYIRYTDALGGAPSPIAGGIHLKTAVGEYYVGDLALNQSSLSWTLMDRNSVADEMKLVLALAALSEVKASGPIKLVTGVPVTWFGDKDSVLKLLQGKHVFARAGARGETTVDIQEVAVVTEPHGTVFSKIIGQDGRVASPALAGGKIGVIDVGMYTTDFLALDKLGYLEPASGSLQTGMGHVYEMVARAIQNQFGLQDLEPHHVDRLIRSGQVVVSGQEHSLAEIVEPALQGLARKIIARATSLPSLWKDGGANLPAIFISGGGAHHLGPYLARAYPHADILAGAVTANVRGFYNAACYKWLPKPKPAPKKKTRSRKATATNGAHVHAS